MLRVFSWRYRLSNMVGQKQNVLQCGLSTMAGSQEDRTMWPCCITFKTKTPADRRGFIVTWSTESRCLTLYCAADSAGHCQLSDCIETSHIDNSYSSTHVRTGKNCKNEPVYTVFNFCNLNVVQHKRPELWHSSLYICKLYTTCGKQHGLCWNWKHVSMSS